MSSMALRIAINEQIAEYVHDEPTAFKTGRKFNRDAIKRRFDVMQEIKSSDAIVLSEYGKLTTDQLHDLIDRLIDDLEGPNG
jgi:hypothetical protein